MLVSSKAAAVETETFQSMIFISQNIEYVLVQSGRGSDAYVVAVLEASVRGIVGRSGFARKHTSLTATRNRIAFPCIAAVALLIAPGTRRGAVIRSRWSRSRVE